MLGKLAWCGTLSLVFVGFACDLGWLIPRRVGGIVSDLTGEIGLQINGERPIVITRNGPFKFKNRFQSGESYRVTIHHQPKNQICKLYNPSGVISGADVDNVTVRCFGPSIYEVGGEVTGLVGTLTLGFYAHTALSLPEEHLEIKRDGPYKFKTKLPRNTSYHVFVIEKPKGQICGSVEAIAKERVVDSNITDEHFRCEKATELAPGG